MPKKPNVFWDTIREARAMVEKGTRGPTKARHSQKKMPLKMLKGVRAKMKKKIRKEREMNIEAGVIYNSFHGKERKHFAINRIRNEKKKEKLLRNDFGKTSKILKAEQKIMENRMQRKERRKKLRKEKKLERRGHVQKIEKKTLENKINEKKLDTKKHLTYQDGILHINPKLFN